MAFFPCASTSVMQFGNMLEVINLTILDKSLHFSSLYLSILALSKANCFSEKNYLYITFMWANLTVTVIKCPQIVS